MSKSGDGFILEREVMVSLRPKIELSNMRVEELEAAARFHGLTVEVYVENSVRRALLADRAFQRSRKHGGSVGSGDELQQG